MRLSKLIAGKKNILFRIAEILLGVSLFCLGDNKTIYFKDSETFIFWSTLDYRKGYTLYPLFLKLCRNILGENAYIEYIWLAQSLLAIFSIIFLTELIRKEYCITYSLSLLINVLLYMPYTFTFPESMATHYIFTEGIAISLFYFSFGFLLKCMQKLKWYKLICLFIFDYLLLLTRPQLIVITVIDVFILALRLIYDKYLRGRMRLKLFASLFIAILLWTSSYVLLGVIADVIYDRPIVNQLIDSISGKIIATVEEEDISSISGIDKDIVKSLYQFAEDNNTLLKDFPESWLEYEDIHMIINKNSRDYEEIVWDSIEVYKDNYDADYSYRAKNRAVSYLLKANKGRFYYIVMRLMPSSMVGSIFVQPLKYRVTCYVFTLLIYLASLCLIVYSLWKKIEEKYRYPHIAVLILITLNAFFCNITLYGQQRYVIYCMGLFYVTLVLLLLGCYRCLHAGQGEYR